MTYQSKAVKATKAKTERQNEIRSQLRQFNCTNGYYNYGRFKYTDGVNYLTTACECYWLLDIIASYQPSIARDRDLQSFQIWVLSVPQNRQYPESETQSEDCDYPFLRPNKKLDLATVTCWRDTPDVGVKPPIKQDIPYTDFLLSEVKLYLENGVLMLPSER